MGRRADGTRSGKSKGRVEKFVLQRPKDTSSFASGQSKVSVTRKLRKFLLQFLVEVGDRVIYCDGKDRQRSVGLE